MNSIFALPTRSGWDVEWETGEIREHHYKNGKVRRIVYKETFTTTDYDKALQKKAEVESKGFKNVQIFECMF